MPMPKICFVTVLLTFFAIHSASADFIPTQAFSDHEKNMIGKGLMLFNSKSFAGRYADGYYTDPNPKTQVFDFWSNGKWAKFDRDGDGHHETIFRMLGESVEYVGTLGGAGTFIMTSSSTTQFLNRSHWDWVKTM